MEPFNGIKIGVFVEKCPDSQDCKPYPSDTRRNGFIDREAHCTFVENIFATSPYNPKKVKVSK